ncbi:hypothetical protein PGT21_020774 [Puccinia graminis f. sp. tritici]|uniref:SAM domain-containing protein n=1 Tax=Puccinia graminis f. sp. tritici TaxID=56615 RepID=A0A5B0QVM5_PUCGR|nr:hypothetical protein PGT21_020774 [Puccinia graminis f. sp. tritici]KAA1117229.1 hypothetical protein PGTUg99_037184 [Puccinia graminis f. sp. tritici]
MDWKQFQDGALIFLSSSTAYLLPAMQYANLGKTISWFASIANHPKYRSPHGIRLQGNLDYLAFGAAASAAYPAAIKFRLIMKDPRDDDPDLKYDWRLTKIRGNGSSAVHQSTEMLSQSTKSSASAITRDADEMPSSDSGSDYPLALTDRHVSKHQRYNIKSISPSGSSNVEIVGLPQRLFLPEIQAESSNPKVGAKVPRSPMAPPRRDMDEISMENYLVVAKIPKEDMRTRERLIDHGITHWSFFRSCDEDELKELGFLPGVARLLWEGVPRLREYCDGLEDNHFITSPTPPRAALE